MTSPSDSFDGSRLTAQQVAELKASAISPEIAERQGLYSIDDARAAAKLFGRAPKHWEDHLPVLVFPYWLPLQRDPVVQRGKPARAFEEQQRDGSVKLAKYTQAAKSGTHLFFGPSLRGEGKALTDPGIPLVLTEGEKKALSAESAGISAIALPGVHQWHLKGETRLHPYFVHLVLKSREIFLCFDADSLQNKDVRKQELNFGRALEAAGAVVHIVRFPPDAPKLDDYLATHEVSELHQLFDDARKRGRLPVDTASAGAASEEWKGIFASLRKDPESGLPVKDVDNISRILMKHPAWDGVLAFDARRERQTFERPPPFAADVVVDKAPIPRPLIDSDVTRISDWLVSHPCLGWTTQPQPSAVERAVAIACERNRIDRVRDYLVALTWDKRPRLDTMGAVYFGAPDSIYTRAVFAKWMLSAVARVRTPGCQVDHVLVLEGKQGIGKSSALRTLAGGDENFSDTLPDISTKDAHEHCIGPWIIELAELDHMRKSEVSAMKAFISARAPAFRSAYAHRTAEHPRRCVFAATTNDGSYLADPTGGRRFWPVECSTIDAAALARDRDQLWAEALVRVRAGEAWHLTDQAAREQAEEAQASRRDVDAWHTPVALFVKGRLAVTVGDVLDHLGHGPEDTSGYGSYQRERGRKGWQYDQRSANRVSSILRELGWVRRMIRVEGHRVWQYVQDRPDVVTGQRDRGDTGVTAQVVDFVPKSPPSPPSPPDRYSNVRAPVRDVPAPADATGTPAPGFPLPLSVDQSLNSSSDSSDPGSPSDLPKGYGVTPKSPVAPDAGDTADPRRKTRL